jgi:hypothetical protein
MHNPSVFVAVVGALIATESVAERRVPPAHSSAFAASGVMFNVPASAQAAVPAVAAHAKAPGEHPLGGAPGQQVRQVAQDGGKPVPDVMQSCR